MCVYNFSHLFIIYNYTNKNTFYYTYFTVKNKKEKSTGNKKNSHAKSFMKTDDADINGSSMSRKHGISS